MELAEFGEESSSHEEALVLAMYDERFQRYTPSDRKAYAVFSGKVCTKGDERTVNREPKEYDNEHST